MVTDLIMHRCVVCVSVSKAFVSVGAAAEFACVCFLSSSVSVCLSNSLIAISIVLFFLLIFFQKHLAKEKRAQYAEYTKGHSGCNTCIYP